jgi:hypothetical protein
MNCDVVMPVIERDIDRLAIFMRSWDRYWQVPGRLLLCAPAAELPAFKQFTQGRSNVEIIAKQDVIGDEPYKRGVDGWLRQQMVKLGIARFVGQTDRFYMAVDADVFIARPLRYTDIFQNGRAPANLSKTVLARQQHLHTNARMAMDLDPLVEPQTQQYTWTPPFIFSRELVLGALAAMENGKGMDWASVLCATPTWGEVFVYHTYALAMNRWHDFHYECATMTDSPLKWPPVNAESEFAKWNPAETFGRYMFGVLQSYAKIAPERCLARVAPFL